MLAGRARRLDRHQDGDEALPCRHAVIRAGRYIHPSIILRAIVNDRNKRTSCEGLLSPQFSLKLSLGWSQSTYSTAGILTAFSISDLPASLDFMLCYQAGDSLSRSCGMARSSTVLISAPHAATAGTMHCMRLPVAMDPMGALTTCSATSNVGYGIFLDQSRNNV